MTMAIHRKYDNVRGYWKEHEGLRIPEIPTFNDELLNSGRFSYFVDHVTKSFCTDYIWWDILEENHLTSLECTMPSEKYKKMCEVIENAGSNIHYIWTTTYNLPSGFEISVKNTFLFKDEEKLANLAVSKLRNGWGYIDDWTKIWDEEAGYNIQPILQAHFKKSLQKEGMWGKTLQAEDVTKYNKILNDLIDETHYWTCKAICQIMDIKEEDIE